MSTTRAIARLTIAAALLAVSLPAAAEWPEGRAYLGVHVGGTYSAAGWDLGDLAYDDGLALMSEPFLHVGPRIGYQATSRFALEIGGSVLPVRSTDTEAGIALQYDLDAVYHLDADAKKTPFLLVGAGLYHLVDGTLATDIDPVGRVGLGYRGLLRPGLALRVEGRLAASDGFDLLGSSNIEVRAGLDWWPFSKASEEDLGLTDRDGDGVLDADDDCPDVAGRKRTKGCPDVDRDGVVDAEDECPKQRGLKSHQGCLPDEVAKYIGAIEGIYFETGSAAIKAESLPILDEAVSVMERFPEVLLRIEGHTDAQGEDEFNLQLSNDRANAVRTYMVDKGVADDRLSAVGYGETKPVGDNETSEGRALNRRIEFQMIEEAE